MTAVHLLDKTAVLIRQRDVSGTSYFRGLTPGSTVAVETNIHIDDNKPVAGASQTRQRKQ